MPIAIQIGNMIGGGAGSASVAPSPPPVTGFKFEVSTNTRGGASSADEFQLPLIASGNYNFEVDWGDSTTDTITTWNQAETLHTYSAQGTYVIECTGTLEGFAFAAAGDDTKINEIFNWGGSNLNLGSSPFAFSGCVNLTVSATNTPANTGALLGTFFNTGSSTFTGGLAAWDMSNVTSCESLCQLSSNYNEDISGWDVSNITNFTNAFSGTAMSVANYDALLIAWSAQTVQSGVTFSTSAQYTLGGAAAAGRATLISNGWTIVDGGGI